MPNFRVTRTSVAVIFAETEKDAIRYAETMSNTGIFSNDTYAAWQTLEPKQYSTTQESEDVRD